MKPRRPKKTKPGDAWREMQRLARLRLQIEEKDARHAARIQDFVDREREALLIEDAQRRAVRLDRIRHQRAEEIRRHKAATDKLRSKFRQP